MEVVQLKFPDGEIREVLVPRDSRGIFPMAIRCQESYFSYLGGCLYVAVNCHEIPDFLVAQKAAEDYKSRQSLQNLREKLADLEHRQWAHWTKYMLDNLTEENIERWKRQIDTPYEELSEIEKTSDREWANKVIETINKETK